MWAGSGRGWHEVIETISHDDRVFMLRTPGGRELATRLAGRHLLAIEPGSATAAIVEA